MAAAVAAAGAGEPQSPDELLPKGDAEKPEEELEEDDDEELDETLSERLWGLTEMFPERVRSAAGATFDLSLFVAQKMYRFSRAALWIGTTSFMILVLPVVFETEKLQMEQQQQLQQRQVSPDPGLFASGGDASYFTNTLVPNLFGTRDWFHGRQFLHGRWVGGGGGSGGFLDDSSALHFLCTEFLLLHCNI
ncbi:mitochondrial import receptor subunit TOM22 homolog isoform X1 [Symphalangus syndactylus]